MAKRFSKRTVIIIFCYCREAERSVDHALSPPMWPHLVAYYDQIKRMNIRELVDTLGSTELRFTSVPDRNSFYRGDFRTGASAVLNRLGNLLQKTWSVSDRETAFLAATLELLLTILHQPEPPPTRDLVELRMDFHACQWIIEHKLIGIRELRQASNIGHFNQSEWVSHVTFQQMEAALGGGMQLRTAKARG